MRRWVHSALRLRISVSLVVVDTVIIIIACFILVYWLGSLVVRVLDWRLDGREFDSRPPRLVLGWV